jgi:hypothetical protein
MSTRNLPGGKGRPARKTDSLTAICELTVWKMWDPRRLTTQWVSTACYRDSFFTCQSSDAPYKLMSVTCLYIRVYMTPGLPAQCRNRGL